MVSPFLCYIVIYVIFYADGSTGTNAGDKYQQGLRLQGGLACSWLNRCDDDVDAATLYQDGVHLDGRRVQWNPDASSRQDSTGA